MELCKYLNYYLHLLRRLTRVLSKDFLIAMLTSNQNMIVVYLYGVVRRNSI